MMPFDGLITALLNNAQYGLKAIFNKAEDANYNAYEAYAAANAAKVAAVEAGNAVQASVPITGAVVDYVRKSNDAVTRLLNAGMRNVVFNLTTSYQTILELVDVIIAPYNADAHQSYTMIQVHQAAEVTLRITINDSVTEFAPEGAGGYFTFPVPSLTKIKRLKIEAKRIYDAPVNMSIYTSDQPTLYYFNW